MCLNAMLLVQISFTNIINNYPGNAQGIYQLMMHQNVAWIMSIPRTSVNWDTEKPMVVSWKRKTFVKIMEVY